MNTKTATLKTESIDLPRSRGVVVLAQIIDDQTGEVVTTSKQVSAALRVAKHKGYEVRRA